MYSYPEAVEEQKLTKAGLVYKRYSACFKQSISIQSLELSFAAEIPSMEPFPSQS